MRISRTQGSQVKSVRKPICGGDVVTQNLKKKVIEIVRRNKLRAFESQSRNNGGSEGGPLIPAK